MNRTTPIIALALLLTAQADSKADTRIQSLCGPDHVNEAASQDDIHPNPAGYYVASLREQVRDEDIRIVLTTSGGFHLCTRPAATPDMDSSKALLLMHERIVKYLFVPVVRRGLRTPS